MNCNCVRCQVICGLHVNAGCRGGCVAQRPPGAAGLGSGTEVCPHHIHACGRGQQVRHGQMSSSARFVAVLHKKLSAWEAGVSPTGSGMQVLCADQGVAGPADGGWRSSKLGRQSEAVSLLPPLQGAHIQPGGRGQLLLLLCSHCSAFLELSSTLKNRQCRAQRQPRGSLHSC